MTAPTVLYLARHGQSEWNHQSRITGRTDVGLSDKGVQQGEALAQCLRGQPLDAIVTSSLRRTADTAAATARLEGLPIRRMAAFDEIDVGVLEGRCRDDSDPEAKDLWARWHADLWNVRVPGAEFFGDFARRVEQALGALLEEHAGRHVLLVGHRATNRVIMGRLMGWPLERWVEIRLRNKFFYRLELGRDVSISTYTLSGSKTGRRVDGFVM